MPPSAALICPPEWRSLFRSLLRESSYLPDPIAKGFMHDHIRQRFRRYAHETTLETDITRQHQLRKMAKQRLTLLRRANEGYTKSLEQVLRLSYGRTGRRRRDLVTRFITPDTKTPKNTDEVAAILHTPSMLDDSWTPPQLVLDLLKSQQRNGVVHELGVRPLVKTLEPPIPKENAWGKPVSVRRRRNIRQRWYSAVLGSLFPPLPGEELRILRGLIEGRSVPWTPPKRRRQIQDHQQETGREARARLSPEFLVEGPAKGHTFRQYVDGRPHNITRRFMRRLWQRIVCLVPVISWNDASHKYHVEWEPIKPLPPLALTMGAEQAADLFANVDTATPGSSHKPKHPRAP